MKRQPGFTNLLLGAIALFPAYQCLIPFPGLVQTVQAQITGAADGTNTLVSPPVANTVTITGGTTGGNNLFHSFQQFGLSAGQTANFMANPAIQNILGRVTGGQASVIDGRIQVTGANANLYLINPAGIIFGPGATLNVPGSFAATTANGIGFGNNWFNATGPNNYAALTGNPTAFAFTMNQPGGIINAGNLAVGAGQTLMLVGGTVVSTGTLSAPEGQIAIATVPGQNLVRIMQAGQLLSLEIQPLTPADTQPIAWALPIASLPQLLTGSGLGNATGMVDNGDGTVSLIGSGTKIQNGDLIVTQTTANGPVPPGVTPFPNAVFMLSSNTLTVGDVETIGSGFFPAPSQSIIKLFAVGNINAGNLDTQTGFIGYAVNLASAAGNITVKTINAGEGGIDLTAAGLFRATGVLGNEYSASITNYPSQDPTFLPFITTKTGLTPEQFATVPNPGGTGTRVFVPTPVSLRTYLGNITLRYGTGSSIRYEGSDLSTTVTAAGTAPFVVGPRIIPGAGDAFLPRNPTDTFATFATQAFSMTKNITAAPISLPDGVSGTVGAIVRTVTGDGSLVVAVQDRVFGILPSQPLVKPDGQPKSQPETGTSNVALNGSQFVQNQFTNRTQTATCNGMIAVASVSSVTDGRSSNTSVNSSSAPAPTPCTSTVDDAKILKILGEEPQ